jgi:DNA-binding response OmpR family regulator
MRKDRSQFGARLNLLLTEHRQQAPEHWARQLPRLLASHGIEPYTVSTGREAFDLAERVPIHAALIDLATPLGERRQQPEEAFGGLSLLELLRRMPDQPPVVVINSRAYSERQLQRLLNEALRRGAFSVIDRPRDLEALLAAIQRMIDRRYHGHWPAQSDHPGGAESDETD